MYDFYQTCNIFLYMCIYSVVYMCVYEIYNFVLSRTNRLSLTKYQQRNFKLTLPTCSIIWLLVIYGYMLPVHTHTCIHTNIQTYMCVIHGFPHPRFTFLLGSSVRLLYSINHENKSDEQEMDRHLLKLYRANATENR